MQRHGSLPGAVRRTPPPLLDVEIPFAASPSKVEEGGRHFSAKGAGHLPPGHFFHLNIFQTVNILHGYFSSRHFTHTDIFHSGISFIRIFSTWTIPTWKFSTETLPIWIFLSTDISHPDIASPGIKHLDLAQITCPGVLSPLY